MSIFNRVEFFESLNHIFSVFVAPLAMAEDEDLIAKYVFMSRPG